MNDAPRPLPIVSPYMRAGIILGAIDTMRTRPWRVGGRARHTESGKIDYLVGNVWVREDGSWIEANSHHYGWRPDIIERWSLRRAIRRYVRDTVFLGEER